MKKIESETGTQDTLLTKGWEKTLKREDADVCLLDACNLS